MRVIILASGGGTRLTEETEVKPKPMLERVERLILWHIMKHYAYYTQYFWQDFPLLVVRATGHRPASTTFQERNSIVWAQSFSILWGVALGLAPVKLV